MKVYHKLEELQSIRRPVVTTGTFDGVHLGHRKIIDNLIQSARELDGESVLFTFYPHPRMILNPEDENLQLLNTQSEKIDLLAKAGIDHLVIYPFSTEFASITAEAFVKEILVEAIGATKLVIGYDHRFGHKREGNFEQLRLLSKSYPFEVEEIPPKDLDQINISSTKIRNALFAGDVETANHFLGYSYQLTGVVLAGNRLGRTIGFPTANVQPTYKHKLIPGNGVYAVQVLASGISYPAMLNIGYRPTINAKADKPTIEAHLFNFDGNLYDTEVTISFIHRLRDERKFQNLDELKEQLERDKQHAIQKLA